MITDFFKNIFGNKVNDNREFTTLRLVNGYNPRFISYSDNAYDNLMYRACIDVIARQVAKLTPTVKLTTNSSYYSNLKFLLENKPNEYMNRYEFFYKVASTLFDKNNCFIYTRVQDGRITGLYPVNYNQIEFVEFENEIFAKFRFASRGFTVYIPYSELIHIRRHYNDDELFGSNQTESLKPIFQVLRAIDSGMINAVEGTTQLRGVLKYAGQMKEDHLKQKQQEFVDNYMGINGAGIGILDNKLEFQPIKIEPKTINATQQKLVLDYFSYNFGVSENILKGCANEEEFNSFYELTIEPLLVQFSLEFTNKIFTKFEIQQGNEILLTANKLLFASVATKNNLATAMMPLGAFSINEIREMYGYNPIDNGDRHIVSLNYVDLANANKYQLGDENGSTK